MTEKRISGAAAASTPLEVPRLRNGDLVDRLALAMGEWTPELHTALGRVGRLHLGEPHEDATVRMAYGLLAYVKAQLDAERAAGVSAGSAASGATQEDVA